ncbi:MAG TPA: TIGR02266 family protein [Kofleriaceae bacterium]|nr:TIGR02266 family protein [Kofleriaceae bacterium]
MEERVHDRVPFCVRVQFRNASSLLVAYSVNLSRGGVFLETEEPVEIGSEVTLQLEVPRAGPALLAGRVTWRRAQADKEGPAGIGVEFDAMVDALGELIDSLVTQFAGITVLLLCHDPKERGNIARQLRSIMATAEVVGASDARVAESLLDEDIDLAVIDADADPDGTLQLLGRVQSMFSPVPMVVLAATDELRQRARSGGADEVVSKPPPFGELQTAVMRALGRPTSVKTR